MMTHMFPPPHDDSYAPPTPMRTQMPTRPYDAYGPSSSPPPLCMRTPVARHAPYRMPPLSLTWSAPPLCMRTPVVRHASHCMPPLLACPPSPTSPLCMAHCMLACSLCHSPGPPLHLAGALAVQLSLGLLILLQLNYYRSGVGVHSNVDLRWRRRGVHNNLGL